ncbi:MAG: amidohydrolase family protein [Planctomycetia bacterium]
MTRPPAGEPAFDLLFRGGHVIDPAGGIDGVADVAVRGGTIAAVGPRLTGPATTVVDATGTFVAPGFIDLHGHWYEGGLYGIHPDIGLNHGVTTAVDAGTTGFANFPYFHDTSVQTSRTRVLAFVHVSCLGLQAVFAEELLELRYARPVETALVVDRYRETAVGIKIRIGTMTGSHGNRALDLALAAARDSRTPLMAHISAGADVEYVLGHLRPGDILTHCFHGAGNGMFPPGETGLLPLVWEARRRGVVYDIGHGCGSFSWDSARRAFEHHFWPDTISTDLHRYSLEEPWAVTMPQVMSKFLSLGMPLADVVEKVTAAPARVLGRGDALGSLRLGTAADLVQFRLESGHFTFRDAAGAVNHGERLVVPLLCLRAGVAYRPGAVPSPPPRPLYPCDQPVFETAAAMRAIQSNLPAPRKP